MTRIKYVRYHRKYFQDCGTDEDQKIRLVNQFREEAIAVLRPVKAKVPRPSADLELEWDLTTTDVYMFFSQALVTGCLSESQLSAASLLFFCQQALEANAVSDDIREKILDAWAGLDLDSVEHGEKFPPYRKKGALSPKTIHIRKLVEDHPTLSAIELQKLADKSILGNMLNETFDNKVSQARTVLNVPKPKKSSKRKPQK